MVIYWVVGGEGAWRCFAPGGCVGRMGTVKRARRHSSTEQPLPIAIDPKPLPETLTALGGVPLLVQTFRSLGVGASVRREVRVKERARAVTKPRWWRVSWS